MIYLNFNNIIVFSSAKIEKILLYCYQLNGLIQPFIIPKTVFSTHNSTNATFYSMKIALQILKKNAIFAKTLDTYEVKDTFRLPRKYMSLTRGRGYHADARRA